MLFRTVYGCELEAIYRFIVDTEAPPTQRGILAAFIPPSQAGDVSTQSVEDALSFLESAFLIKTKNGYYYPNKSILGKSFQVQVLYQLRAIETGRLEPHHPLDPLYMCILTEAFIQPNQLFITDVHTETNKLRSVAEVGGLSREKLQAWKRVMEFLGIGQRVASGIQCVYSPQLLMALIEEWAAPEGPLQQFLEECLGQFLPYQTQEGGLAQAVEIPLLHLNQKNHIRLSARQDSSSKPYFGERKFRYITRLGVSDAHL